MGAPSRPPANGFVAAARKVYHPVGISKGYNFVLWFIFGGAFLGFILARLPYLDFYGVFCRPDGGTATLGALPGECYFYLHFDRYKVGVMLHLAGILPAGLLPCLQFTPVVRYRALLLHRVGGWLAILLSVVGIAGALMIAAARLRRRPRGPDRHGRHGHRVSGLLALGRDQHRASPDRGASQVDAASMVLLWTDVLIKCDSSSPQQAGAIITMRIILITAANITAPLGGYYTAMPCVKVAFTVQSDEQTLRDNPACAPYFNGTSPDQWTMITANFNGTDVAQIAAALDMTAGMAL
ncbi:hypothetical protein PG994_007793 [Apiospora phragmitis]|uniref:Uncharacterized protein n=1 Tax=Apiospora phragmitis TaxID=2905665 RepID=A0ABR1UR79_9PEZI